MANEDRDTHGAGGASVGPVTGWFELRAGEQAAGMILARPWVMALPAVSAIAAVVLFVLDARIPAVALLASALLQALLPLAVARRTMGSGPRQVAVQGGRWMELRSRSGEVHRWDLLRCRVRTSRRRVHLEVAPGRAITVPRASLRTFAAWQEFLALVRAGLRAPCDARGTYVAFRSDHRSTRPFDLPVPATIGVLFRQQARALLPLLVVLIVVEAALAPTLALRVMVIVGAAAAGGWALLAGSTLRVLALARRDITRGNVVEAREGGLLHDHPGCASLRPWREVTAVRPRQGGAAEVRYGRRRTVLPAGAFADGAHRDAFVASVRSLAGRGAGTDANP